MTMPTIRAISIVICSTFSMLLPSSASAIENGFVAETCVWPETVRIFSGWGVIPADDVNSKITCTGIYVGGRIVLTASACVQQLPAAYEVQFGDTFGSTPRSTLVPHAAIPIETCLAHPSLPVSACRLSEEPGMQAIPIMHECEAPSFFAQGNDLWLVGANDTKRWVNAQLLNDLPVEPDVFSLPQDFAWMTPQGLDSTVLEDEDLGAPLIARGPDGSLRVAAIAVGVDPAEWVGTWLLVDWLLGLAQPSAILPCHAADGTWQPGPGCASLLGDRTQSAGDWARGPNACEATAQVVPAPTC